ncbi:hypothetical protein GCM10011384_36030 [Psychrobacillus lasiicapitis]|nr:hypothetical protein GCM10011384_36030 [Psychrobacillus lasiicapitis]
MDVVLEKWGAVNADTAFPVLVSDSQLIFFLSLLIKKAAQSNSTFIYNCNCASANLLSTIF